MQITFGVAFTVKKKQHYTSNARFTRCTRYCETTIYGWWWKFNQNGTN